MFGENDKIEIKKKKKGPASGFVIAVHTFGNRKDSQTHFSLLVLPSCDSPALRIKLKICRVKYEHVIRLQPLDRLMLVKI